MNRNKFLKQILGIIVIAVILSIINVGEVKAGLQANRKVEDTVADTPQGYIVNFRKMETTGEAMGLEEALNEDLTASSESNNIDIHMMRTTEYGAMAILTASEYGNPSKERALTSTTGNRTGIIMKRSTFLAGGLEGNIFSGTNRRYYDTYTINRDSARVGDALGYATTVNPGCANWYGEIHTYWFTEDSPYSIRGGNGIFAVYADRPTARGWSRGSAVCGVGI